MEFGTKSKMLFMSPKWSWISMITSTKTLNGENLEKKSDPSSLFSVSEMMISPLKLKTFSSVMLPNPSPTVTMTVD